MDKYLRPTAVIECDSPVIRAKARDLTEGLNAAREKAVALFYYVRDQVRFNPYSAGEVYEYNRATLVLERGHGFCYQKAILLAALARASGIPARLGFADIRNHRLSERFLEKMFGNNVLVYHGWTEMLIDGKWVRATPAYDLEMCLEHGYVPVEFDGTADARLHTCTRDGGLHIEYIAEHGHYDDLPWEEILAAHNRLLAQMGVARDSFMQKWTEGE
jgi:transglutaminase-like putative cysteine protease